MIAREIYKLLIFYVLISNTTLQVIAICQMFAFRILIITARLYYAGWHIYNYLQNFYTNPLISEISTRFGCEWKLHDSRCQNLPRTFCFEGSRISLTILNNGSCRRLAFRYITNETFELINPRITTTFRSQSRASYTRVLVIARRGYDDEYRERKRAR